MRGRITGKAKIKEGRGTGTGADYKPWIMAREISSTGTKSILTDWKHGRQIQLLSRNETYFYCLLRWDDHVIDINEQYPLDRDITEQISAALSVRHPVPNNDADERMTTDFYVTYREDTGVVTHKAYSVKDNYEQIFGDVSDPSVKRLVEKQRVEMAYWHLKGVPFKIIFGDRDINKIFARNIDLVTQHYNPENVQTREEFAMYLIAHKMIDIDMISSPVDISDVVKRYLSQDEQMK